MKVIVDFMRNFFAQPWPILAWLAVLMAVNLLCGLLYIETAEGVAVLVALAVAAVLMVVLFAATGFSRLLGVAHVTWIPLVIWLAVRLDSLPAGGGQRRWVIAVILFNAVSLVLDVRDTTRWLRGERKPMVTPARGA